MVDPSGFGVRSPKSSEEVKSLWWPSMQSLGWNRSDKDHATHWRSSHGDYIVLTHRDATSRASGGEEKKGEAEEEEKPVGIVLPITFPNKTGWVGFFVVNEAYRGTGNGGRMLFQAALDAFARRGTARVGLDGVLQQVGTYSRRGFIEKGRVKLMVTRKVKELMVPDPEEGGGDGDGRLAAAVAATAEVEEAEVQKVETGVMGRPRLKALKEVRPAALVAADEKVSGLRREDLWTEGLFVEREDAWGFAVEQGDGAGGEEEVLGFVLVRSCEQGYRVGPLYAQTPGWAKALLVQVMQTIKGFGSVAAEKSLVAEVWGENPDAVKAFEEAGWEYSGVDYARMWLNGKETDAQKKGGVAEKEAFAWFDAGEG